MIFGELPKKGRGLNEPLYNVDAAEDYFTEVRMNARSLVFKLMESMDQSRDGWQDAVAEQLRAKIARHELSPAVLFRLEEYTARCLKELAVQKEKTKAEEEIYEQDQHIHQIVSKVLSSKKYN